MTQWTLRISLKTFFASRCDAKNCDRQFKNGLGGRKQIVKARNICRAGEMERGRRPARPSSVGFCSRFRVMLRVNERERSNDLIYIFNRFVSHHSLLCGFSFYSASQCFLFPNTSSHQITSYHITLHHISLHCITYH